MNLELVSSLINSLSGLFLFGTCEPMPILATIWWSPNASLLFITKSIGLLAAAIFIKTIIFAMICRIGFWRATGMMGLANIYSTIPGIIAAVILTVPDMLFLLGGLVLIMVISYRLGVWVYGELEDTSWQWLSPGNFSGLTVLCTFITIVLTRVATNLLSGNQLTEYWIAKFSLFYIGLLVSFMLTIGWEGSVAAKYSKNKDWKPAILRSTVIANLITFFLIAAVGAAIAIPQRLMHPDWLLLPK